MFISWMLTRPSFKKSLIVEQFQGNYLKYQWKFRHMCQNCVKNNESLATDFRVLIATLLNLIATLLNLECTNDETVGRIVK